MFVPIPTGSPTSTETAPALDEPREMAVAIRLLAGKDCERDPQQAHLMLVRLSESRVAVIRDEAARILKAGASNHWFSDRAPKYYELERIAEKSLALRDRSRDTRKTALTLGIGLAALFGGLVAFLVANGSENTAIVGQSVIAVLIVAILIAMVLYRTSGRT